MRLGKLLGWGVVIYALMFLLWSIFVAYGFSMGFAPRALGLIFLIGICLIAGRSVRMHSWKDVLPYSIGWVVVIAMLDALLSVPFTGWQIFLDWNIWVGYGIVLLVPLTAPLIHGRAQDHT